MAKRIRKHKVGLAARDWIAGHCDFTQDIAFSILNEIDAAREVGDHDLAFDLEMELDEALD